MLKLSKKQQGFTLVELLVAIAIIAILAVIGLTVFTGLQRGARDATRRGDVLAISKAMEANYQTTTALYNPLRPTMFAGGRAPQDPLEGSLNGCAGASCGYCIAWQTAAGPNPVGILRAGASAPCATIAAPVGPASSTGTSLNTAVITGASAIPGATTTGYVICANLEAAGSGQFYCQGSQR